MKKEMVRRKEVCGSYSKTQYYKKITKPLLERKRRARMNRCLEELKEYVVGALMMESETVSRLEKADVLELTVKHLREMEEVTKAREEGSRFQAGFTQCAAEAYNLILNSPEIDSQIGQQLVDHLQTVVGPLSIQVPNFRLIFSSDDGEKCRKAECCSGGLLMVADGGQVAREQMWRPW